MRRSPRRRNCGSRRSPAPDVHDAARNLLVRASLQHLRRDHARRARGRARRSGPVLHNVQQQSPFELCRKCRHRDSNGPDRIEAESGAGAVSDRRRQSSIPAAHGSAVACPAGGSANICVQAPVQFFPAAGGVPGVCGVSVSFQYPFQFWLPFTSLSKQRIWIAASARVRMETR